MYELKNQMGGENTHNVIGEGGFGCVLEPSLKCNVPTKINYKTKVSKILRTKYAKEELHEYNTISKIDKSKKYYLGVPKLCKVKNTRKNIKAIQKCENEQFFNYYPELPNVKDVNIDGLSLLIMENGGLNLYDYADNISKLAYSSKNSVKMEKFWMEMYNIILGIQLLLENELMHYDLNGNNIVYSEKNNQLRFIDFGKMTKQSILKHKISKNELIYSFHWSYPLESLFLDKIKFNTIQNLSTSQLNSYFSKITKFYTSNSKSKKTKFYESLNSFCANSYSYVNTEIVNKVIQDYSQFIVFDMKGKSFNEFTHQFMRTFDIYGLGMGCMYVLMKTRHVMNADALFYKLYNLFESMITPRLFHRITIGNLIQSYEDILHAHILPKYGLVIKDNHFIKKSSLKIKIKPVLVKDKLSKHELREIMTSEPEMFIYSTTKTKTNRKCSIGKIRDSRTDKCVKLF